MALVAALARFAIARADVGPEAGDTEPSAQRDIADLMARHILAVGPAGGRSTHYLLAEQHLADRRYRRHRWPRRD